MGQLHTVERKTSASTCLKLRCSGFLLQEEEEKVMEWVCAFILKRAEVHHHHKCMKNNQSPMGKKV